MIFWFYGKGITKIISLNDQLVCSLTCGRVLATYPPKLGPVHCQRHGLVGFISEDPPDAAL